MAASDHLLPSPVTEGVPDIDLALEEKYATLFAEHTDMKKRLADTITRLEYLQHSHAELLDQSREQSRKLAVFENNNDSGLKDWIDNLKVQLDEANELIAKQESQIETDRVTKEKQDKELTKLRPFAGRLQDLEDEVKELKIENISLLKKANTVDNLQRKIDIQSGIEKENTRLHEQLDVLESNQTDYDRVFAENERLKKTYEEYEKRFRSYELEVVDATSQRKALEENLRQKQHIIDGLVEKKRHDETYIADLQEQLNINAQFGISESVSPTGEIKAAPMSLEDELAQSDEPGVNYPLEISRLRAEIQLLRTTSGGLTNVELRKDLDEAEFQQKVLLEKNTKLLEDQAVTKDQLSALLSHSEDEMLVQAIDIITSIGPYQMLTNNYHRTAAISNTRKLYLDANQEIKKLKSTIAELNLQLSSKERELVEAKADRKLSLSLPLSVEFQLILQQ